MQEQLMVTSCKENRIKFIKANSILKWKAVCSVIQLKSEWFSNTNSIFVLKISGEPYKYLITLRSTELQCLRKTFPVKDSPGDLRKTFKLPLDRLQVAADKPNIVLSRRDGTNVLDNYQQLKFICQPEEFESWNGSLSSVINYTRGINVSPWFVR